MFLALRDIVSARGRFSLISFVVGLITVLLVMLTGLTGGLAKHNTSALEALAPERYVFTSEKPSFQDSQVTTSDVQEWQDLVDADSQVVPLGTAQTRLEAGSALGVAVLGLPAGTTVPAPVVSAAPHETQEPQETVLGEDGIVISRDIVAEAGVQPGETVEIGGVEQPVSAVVEDEYYSHQPVVWASTQVWQQILRAHDDVVGTVLAVDTGTGTQVPCAMRNGRMPKTRPGIVLQQSRILFWLGCLPVGAGIAPADSGVAVCH